MNYRSPQNQEPVNQSPRGSNPVNTLLVAIVIIVLALLFVFFVWPRINPGATETTTAGADITIEVGGDADSSD